MKILYICESDPKPASGVTGKIATQVAAWRKLGAQVDLLSYESLKYFDAGMQPHRTAYSFCLPPGPTWFFQRQMVASYRLWRLARTLDYDICYCRYLIYTPFLLPALSRAGRRLVFEINSDENKEWATTSRLLWGYNKLGRRTVLSATDGLVCVTPELAESYRTWTKSLVTVANGVCTSDYPFIEATGNKQLRVYFICSSGQKWQGIDKVKRLARLLPAISFHIIGVQAPDGPNLSFYGQLPETKVTGLLCQADAALSTLALHRKNLRQGCPLKSRQYLAMGIPMVYAYEDPDLPANAPFALRIRNTADNIDKELEAIADFFLQSFGNAAIRRQARRHAEDFLDVRIKEQDRLSFFQQL